MISKLHTSKVKFNFLFSSNHVQVVVVLERIRSIPCRIWKTIMLRMLSIISFEEFMQGDCDADAYIDYYSKEVVSIFSKEN